MNVWLKTCNARFLFCLNIQQKFLYPYMWYVSRFLNTKYYNNKMGIFPSEIKITDNDVLCIAAASATDLITRVKQISMTANPVNGAKFYGIQTLRRPF